MMRNMALCQIIGDQAAYDLASTFAQAINDQVCEVDRRAVLEALKSEFGIGMIMENDRVVVAAVLLR